MRTKNDSMEKPPNAEADMKAPEFAQRELLDDKWEIHGDIKKRHSVYSFCTQ